MSVAQIILIFIIVIPLFFVFKNWVSLDLAAIIMAVVIGTAQFLGIELLGPAGDPKEVAKSLSGLGQPVVLTLVGIFILTRALEKSGVTRLIALKLMQVGGASESRLITLFSVSSALLSLFMNNLAAGALLLPSAMEVARRTDVKPSKLLIPVAYGSLLGGSATYFTTANIIVSDLLKISQPAQAPLRILDFAPTGGLIAIAGVAFLSVFGTKLLPDRQPSDEQNFSRVTSAELEDLYGIGERLWEACVEPESELVGKTLIEAGFGKTFGVEIVGIWHGRQAIFYPQPDQIICSKDILLVIGREERINLIKEMNVKIGRETNNGHISRQGVKIIEIVLSPRSSTSGHTLKELDFRRRYGFTAIALKRLDKSYRTNVGDIKLALGDSLLLIGSPSRVQGLEKSADFIVLQPVVGDQLVNYKQTWLVSIIVVAAIIATIAGFPVYLSMLMGAIVVLLLGILTMEEAYHAIEWKTVFLISGMFSVSLALVYSGLAAWLGKGILLLAAPFGPIGLDAGAYLLTSLLTQIMGGQVSALITGPVAITAAIQMGTSPQAVAVATAIGCSASFITPFAHPVNILMVAPANYKFSDFFHIGWRLTVISFLMLLLGLKFFWKI